MGKKQRRGRQANENFDDKPAYAADRPVVEKAEKPNQSVESGPQVREHLNEQTVNKLARLKASMLEAGVAVSAPPAKVHMARPQAPTQERILGKSEEIDKEKSFQELFDPEPGEEDSFTDLLKDSKLDWRSFK